MKTLSKRNLIFLLWEKLNVPMFKGKINDVVNLYQSCVLKMANINMFDLFLFFPFIT